VRAVREERAHSAPLSFGGHGALAVLHGHAPLHRGVARHSIEVCTPDRVHLQSVRARRAERELGQEPAGVAEHAHPCRGEAASGEGLSDAEGGYARRSSALFEDFVAAMTEVCAPYDAAQLGVITELLNASARCQQDATAHLTTATGGTD
jgi:hypothetical protein